jgi:hypothetical protein
VRETAEYCSSHLVQNLVSFILADNLAG